MKVCSHDCCGHAWMRILDGYGGRVAPTRGQCDCECHEAHAECDVHGKRLPDNKWERPSKRPTEEVTR